MPTNDSNTDSDRESQQMQKTALRTTGHISKFIRLEVQFPDLSRMKLTVDASQSIEYLCQAIEAEFSFQKNSSSAISSFCDPGSDEDRLRHRDSIAKDRERQNSLMVQRNVSFLGMTPCTICKVDASQEPQSSRETLEGIKVNLVYDKYSNSLSLTSKISSAFSHGDVAIIGSSSLFTMKRVENEVQCIFPKQEEKGLSLLKVVTNHTGLALFREYCIVTLCLEHLLFWIEIEIFNSIQDVQLRCSMSEYLYIMYIMEGGPLCIHLPQDIAAELFSQRQDAPINLYDEAQYHSLLILKNHCFPNFAKTEIYTDLMEISKVDFDKHKLTSFSETFRIDQTILHDVCSTSKSNNNKIPVFLVELFINRLIQSYFPTAEPVVGYFVCAATSKQKRIRKKKKLDNFFGANDQKNYEIQVQQQFDSDSSATSDSTPKNSNNMLDEVNESQRRADKLTNFFGTRIETALLELPKVNDEGLCEEERKLLGKRSRKLHQLLGEELCESGTFEAGVRKNYVRQLSVQNVLEDDETHFSQNKLKRIFGTPPPQSYITGLQRKTLAMKHAITTISLMIDQENGIKQMIEYASNCEKEKRLTSEENDVQTNESLAQARRFTKLNNFFGDPVDPHVLIDNYILSKIESKLHTDFATEDQSKSALEEDLNFLRNKIMKLTSKSSQIPRVVITPK